jgi:predicted Rossmann fold nucleotide-binding protein DprA/Smf involved in DNA uptake
LAVLGSGLDRLYPRENEGLARRIAERGCVISEFPMGTHPHAGNFPRRNRIISGLSYGTLVVEAGNDSGALITAEYAAEQGREVFAVPGAIMAPGTRGTHKLIKAGAHLVDNVEDILNVLSGMSQAVPARRLAPATPSAHTHGHGDSLVLALPMPNPEGSTPALSMAAPMPARHSPQRSARRRLPSPSADLKDTHRLLLGLLEGEPRPLEDLAERMRALPGRTQLPTHRLLAELLQLEVLGLVRRLPGAVFRSA